MEHSAQCRPQSVAAAVTAALRVNHTHTEQAWGLPSTTVLFIPMPVVAHSPSFSLEPAPVGTAVCGLLLDGHSQMSSVSWPKTQPLQALQSCWSGANLGWPENRPKGLCCRWLGRGQAWAMTGYPQTSSSLPGDVTGLAGAA